MSQWTPELISFHHKIVSQNPPGTLRRGQWAFNSLHDIRPDLAEKLVMFQNDLGLIYSVDPYYNDKFLDNFFTWLGENW